MDYGGKDRIKGKSYASACWWMHYTLYPFHPLPVRLNGWRSVWYVKLPQHEGLILDFYVYSIFYKVREFFIQNYRILFSSYSDFIGEQKYVNLRRYY